MTDGCSLCGILHKKLLGCSTVAVHVFGCMDSSREAGRNLRSVEIWGDQVKPEGVTDDTL